MNPVLWWMVQNLVSVCVLVVLVSVACLALRNRPAWRHALWLIVLIKFVTPPIVSWPWSLSEMADRVLPVVASFEDAGFQREPEPILNSGRMESDVADSAALLAGGDVTGGCSDKHESISDAPFVDNSGDTSALIEPATASRSAFLDEAEVKLAQQLFVGLWIVGCVVALAIQLRRLSWRQAVVRRGSPAPQPLVDEIGRVSRKLKVRSVPATVVSEIAAPFLWCVGWLRVVWPEALTPEDALHRSRGIIAHELAHVRRRDHWVAWLELAAGIIWWWNPLFWFVRRQLRESAEMACDAIALSVYDDRRVYAEMFLELSSSSKTGMPAPALGVSTGTPSSFERRLTMILSDRVSGKLSICGFLMIGCIAAVALPSFTLAQPSSVGHSGKRLVSDRGGSSLTVPSIGPAPLSFDFAFPVFDAERAFSFHIGFSDVERDGSDFVPHFAGRTRQPDGTNETKADAENSNSVLWKLKDPSGSDFYLEMKGFEGQFVEAWWKGGGGVVFDTRNPDDVPEDERGFMATLGFVTGGPSGGFPEWIRAYRFDPDTKKFDGSSYSLSVDGDSGKVTVRSVINAELAAELRRKRIGIPVQLSGDAKVWRLIIDEKLQRPSVNRQATKKAAGVAPQHMKKATGPSQGNHTDDVPESNFKKHVFRIHELQEGEEAHQISPPDPHDVIEALEEELSLKASSLTHLYEKHRNSFRIVVELLSDKVDPPRFIPLVGEARLHRVRFKCTVMFTETTKAKWPVSYDVSEGISEVVYIDHDHLDRTNKDNVAGSRAN